MKVLSYFHNLKNIFKLIKERGITKNPMAEIKWKTRKYLINPKEGREGETEEYQQ